MFTEQRMRTNVSEEGMTGVKISQRGGGCRAVGRRGEQPVHASLGVRARVLSLGRSGLPSVPGKPGMSYLGAGPAS